MKQPLTVSLLFGVLLLVSGCQNKPGTSTTKGTATVECDEALWPVMKLQIEDFHNTYKDAQIVLRPVEAREAIANFVNDSVRVIVTARPFNREEKDVIARAKVEQQGFSTALDAIAVIGHKENPLKELRLGELDSIFSGSLTQWPGRSKAGTIDIALCGINSSTNEVFKTIILKGRPFSPTATPFRSSEKVVEFVRSTPNAIGIVGLSWLRGKDKDLTVFALGDPRAQPDSTQPVGKYYSPVQYYVFQRYYPITTEVYMYTREVQRDVGLGFISYVNSAPGQKLFLNNGLVPLRMPIRIVELTSKQVTQ
jgi:phosphate transport system substrate-binding protein